MVSDCCAGVLYAFAAVSVCCCLCNKGKSGLYVPSWKPDLEPASAPTPSTSGHKYLQPTFANTTKNENIIIEYNPQTTEV